MYEDEPVASEFLFKNEQNKQIFQHQWYAKDKLHKCPTCWSCIDQDEPPSQHWLRRNDHELLTLSKQQQAILDIIEARHIETFFFCDESSEDKMFDFIGETCKQSVPQLLRWMFHNRTLRIEFNVAFYVSVLNHMLIFQSGTLYVEHHYDIDECVSVIYNMLMKRVENYLICGLDVNLEDGSITRVRVQIKRQRRNAEDEDLSTQILALPMQLRHQASTLSAGTTSQAEMTSLRAAYIKYQRECHGYFPSNMHANLFGLQQCSTTKELFVAPYHISETLQQLPNKNFLIINDVMGQFRCLHEMNSLVAAADVPHPSQLQCRRCGAEFLQRSKLDIHQQLRCGQDFSVDNMHADIVEIYEQCLPISRSESQYACYGITKPKTIMRKGQFVPIECDWRSECSVKVQHGPCVVISHEPQQYSPFKYV